MCGFDVTTRVMFKVVYGPSERLGLMSLALFTLDGGVFHEWAMSGVQDVKPLLMAYLKTNNIRLELTEVDLMASLSTIYYL